MGSVIDLGRGPQVRLRWLQRLYHSNDYDAAALLQPSSLIILALCAVLLRTSQVKYYYLEGLGDQILSIANAIVPTE